MTCIRTVLLLGILTSACGHSAPPNSAGAATTEPGRRPLFGKEIVDGMAKTSPQIHACFATHKTSDTTRIRVRVAESGRVAGVKTLGSLVGTPAADCIEGAIKTAVFRNNPGLTFDYSLDSQVVARK